MSVVVELVCFLGLTCRSTENDPKKDWECHSCLRCFLGLPSSSCVCNGFMIRMFVVRMVIARKEWRVRKCESDRNMGIFRFWILAPNFEHEIFASTTRESRPIQDLRAIPHAIKAITLSTHRQATFKHLRS